MLLRQSALGLDQYSGETGGRAYYPGFKSR